MTTNNPRYYVHQTGGSAVITVATRDQIESAALLRRAGAIVFTVGGQSLGPARKWLRDNCAEREVLDTVAEAIQWAEDRRLNILAVEGINTEIMVACELCTWESTDGELLGSTCPACENRSLSVPR